MSKLKQSGTPLDDDSALMLMARHVLGGPADGGRASYQIALSVCPTCDRGYQHANGELIPVSAEVVAMAECDGQHIGVITPLIIGAKPAKDESAHVGAQPAKDESAHVGAARVRAIDGARAKQTVSPATRRAVRRRDHEQCVVPGCRNAQFLDVHHVALRSEGGGHDADNLTTLCGAHHRAAHRGELVASGSVAAGIRFRHADGGDYGTAPEPRAVEMRAKAFAALCGLGFREGEVRRALAESCNIGVPEMNLERVVRDALVRLTPRCAHV
jgi:5-methylcytosine-specific restriction endonuclease McrA